MNQGAADAARGPGSTRRPGRAAWRPVPGRRGRAAAVCVDDSEHASGGGLGLRDGRAHHGRAGSGWLRRHPPPTSRANRAHQGEGAKVERPTGRTTLAPSPCRAPRWAGRRWRDGGANAGRTAVGAATSRTVGRETSMSRPLDSRSSEHAHCRPGHGTGDDFGPLSRE